MCWSMTVLPALGGDTIRPRWPLPIGAMMSRMQRGEVLEQDLVLARLGRLAVDLVDLDQREVALAVLGGADLALDGVAGVQVEAADLRGADVDVVGAREVGRVGGARGGGTVGGGVQRG